MSAPDRRKAVYELLVREYPDIWIEILTVFGRCPTPSRGSSSGGSDWHGVGQWWADVRWYLAERYGIDDQNLSLSIHIGKQIDRELGVK